MKFNSIDSSLILNDSNFCIRKVIIENNYGYRLYASGFLNNDSIKLFSDENESSKRRILDSINSDAMNKYFAVEVIKKNEDSLIIGFNSTPFMNFNQEIQLEKEKRPSP